jgi:phosphatidylinositol alpha-1,6-mannosyltransferase
VIPNGADEKRFRRLPVDEVAAYRTGLGLGDAQLLLTVGNVSERKGQDVVIRALPHILAQTPNTHYLIAGLPTRRPALEALAQKLGVLDHVHFLGRVSNQELPLLINACDLFVMTSRHTAGGDFEGYGIAVVEAAFCGLPAVVSAPSGLAEAIVDGETGIAVPQDDPEATAQAIIQLLQNGALRQQMGEAARRRALREQTWTQRAAAYDVLLRELLGQTALRYSQTG